MNKLGTSGVCSEQLTLDEEEAFISELFKSVMNKPSCRICGSMEKPLCCTQCKTVYYCSVQHQQNDWPNHKKLCKESKLQKQREEEEVLLELFNSELGNGSIIENNIEMVLDNLLPAFEHENPSNVKQISTVSMKNSFHNRGNDENCYLPTKQPIDIEQRYEDLSRTVISDMNTYGLSVIDDFLGREKGLEIFNEVQKMYAAGVFKDGQVTTNSAEGRNLKTIRGDKIAWVKGVQDGCSNIGYLINQIDAVICRANTIRDNGLLGNYSIKERTKAMVACYPGSGSHYKMHVDNPNSDGRVITAIYYLNVDWDTKKSGGILRIFPDQNGAVADIEPKFDRLLFFWSDRRNPHEVQPAHRTRYAITVWYFDANEREIALNRVRQTNTNRNQTTQYQTLTNALT